jgi:hypothetical protein
MWCVARITVEYRQRMYALLDLYAQPYDAEEPVICLDEKSKQLLADNRQPVEMRPGNDLLWDIEMRGSSRSLTACANAARDVRRTTSWD